MEKGFTSQKITIGGGWDDLSAEDKEIKMKDWRLLRGRGGITRDIMFNYRGARGTNQQLGYEAGDTGFAPGRKPKTNPDLMASRTLLGR